MTKHLVLTQSKPPVNPQHLHKFWWIIMFRLNISLPISYQIFQISKIFRPFVFLWSDDWWLKDFCWHGVWKLKPYKRVRMSCYAFARQGRTVRSSFPFHRSSDVPSQWGKQSNVLQVTCWLVVWRCNIYYAIEYENIISWSQYWLIMLQHETGKRSKAETYTQDSSWKWKNPSQHLLFSLQSSAKGNLGGLGRGVCSCSTFVSAITLGEWLYSKLLLKNSILILHQSLKISEFWSVSQWHSETVTFDWLCVEWWL